MGSSGSGMFLFSHLGAAEVLTISNICLKLPLQMITLRQKSRHREMLDTGMIQENRHDRSKKEKGYQAETA